MKPVTVRIKILSNRERDNPLVKKKKDKRIRLSIFTSADLLCPRFLE